MRADGTTFHPRHTSDPAGTEDLDGRESTGVIHTKTKKVWKTTTVLATRGLRELLLPPGGPELLNDFDEQGMEETCTLTSPASPETEYLPLRLVAPELET